MALVAVCSYDTATRRPSRVDAAPLMAAENQAGCVGNIESEYLVQSCCDTLLRGAERRKDQGQKLAKMDPKLVEDDVGGVGHGRTWEVGIDTCNNVSATIGLGKGEVRTDLLGGN